VLQQAVILAGGLGTRLGVLTKDVPKPMLLVGEHPFIEYLIWNLGCQGIREVVLSVGYKADKFSCYFGNNKYGVTLTYSQEPEPLDTGGALKFAYSKLDSEFLVINGDSLFDINYLNLYNLLQTSCQTMVAMALRYALDVSRYGLVATDGLKVVGFTEKHNGKIDGFINGGVYVMNKRVLKILPEIKFSLESDLFPRLAYEGGLVAKKYDNYFIDIGIPSDYKRAQKELPLWKNNRISSL